MKLLVLLVLPFMLLSCSESAKKTSNDLTSEQRSAFEALSLLQVSTDMPNRLYATFPNIDQPCYPPDTSFTVSQSEMLAAMKYFVSIHCKSMPNVDQTILAETSVKAQNEYTVLHCSNDKATEDYGNGLPMTGIWVMPNVAGSSDVTLVW